MEVEIKNDFKHKKSFEFVEQENQIIEEEEQDIDIDMDTSRSFIPLNTEKKKL